jgi:hypothetical protein
MVTLGGLWKRQWLGQNEIQEEYVKCALVDSAVALVLYFSKVLPFTHDWWIHLFFFHSCIYMCLDRLRLN